MIHFTNNKIKTLTAIDFETATRHHICAVGIVSVEDGKIIDEFHTLIQPSGNEYFWKNIEIHGITGRDTVHAPFFDKVFNIQ